MMDTEIFSYFNSMFWKLFMYVNPHIFFPFFLALTQNHTRNEQRIIARNVGIYALFLSLFFAFLGGSLLSLLGVSNSTFKVAGGILLFFAAIELVNSSGESSRPKSENEIKGRNNIALYPMAFPMLTGPATLTNTVVMMNDAKVLGIEHQVIIIFSLILLILITYCLCRFGSIFSKLLGKNGGLILLKVSGIILVGISLEMIACGIIDRFDIKKESPAVALSAPLMLE